MEPLLAGNIVNVTLGAASALYQLWNYLRRGYNPQSLWAALISLSAGGYALNMLTLYQAKAGDDVRQVYSFLYLAILGTFTGLLGYARVRAGLKIKTAAVAVLGMCSAIFIFLLFATPWIIGEVQQLTPLSASPRPFVQLVLGPLSGLFFLFTCGAVVPALFWVNRHRHPQQNSPLLFNIVIGLMALGSMHDLLGIYFVLNQPFGFFAEYSIVLLSLVLFINSQEDNASLEVHQQRALLASQANLDALLENSLEMILVHEQGRIVYINKAGARYLGYDSPDGLLNRNVIEIVTPEDRPTVIARMQAMLRDNLPSLPPERERLTGRDGRELLTEVSVARILYMEKPCSLVIGRDLSERMAFERQMMQMDRMVAIGTLAAGVAHEINNPLTFVVGNLELIKEDIQQLCEPEALTRAANDLSAHIARNRPVFDELDQLISEANEGAERIHATVTDLSELARDNCGERVQVAMDEVLTSSLRLCNTQTKKRAQVRLELQKIPPVLGDPAKLSQVVINLVVNAAQAIPLGHFAENSIILRLFDQDKWVILEVEDSGQGIDPKVKNTLFDPFVTTKDVGEGTGLGLAISRQIVIDHGGEIEVDSVLGKGSIFHVRLPALVEPLPEEAAASPAVDALPGSFVQ